MKLIPLTQGKFAKVSDCDYKFLMQWKWHYAKNTCDGYACRRSHGPHSERKRIYMADVVAARKGVVGKADHENRDRLDNQRDNLRPATNSQNQGNALWSTNTSGFKGVCFDKQNNRYHVRICVNGRNKSLGWFPPTEFGKVEAAYAYTVAADWYFKEYALYEPVAFLLDSKIKRQIKKDVLQRLSA